MGYLISEMQIRKGKIPLHHNRIHDAKPSADPTSLFPTALWESFLI